MAVGTNFSLHLSTACFTFHNGNADTGFANRVLGRNSHPSNSINNIGFNINRINTSTSGEEG